MRTGDSTQIDLKTLQQPPQCIIKIYADHAFAAWVQTALFSVEFALLVPAFNGRLL